MSELLDLVGAKKAAEILGVYDSHISRLRRRGRMPRAIPVDGSKSVAYVRGEVEALAVELERERKQRAKR